MCVCVCVYMDVDVDVADTNVINFLVKELIHTHDTDQEVIQFEEKEKRWK